MNGDDPPIWLSALEHYVYCPRQCALITVDGVWQPNEHTVRGDRGHRRVDEPGSRTERGKQVLRAVPVWSERLGLAGRADLIEVHAEGTVVPVEYKMGRRHGLAADVQLCALAFCLEEMLQTPIPSGQLWFGTSRRRTNVSLDEPLRAMTLEVIDGVRQLASATNLPPAPNDQRCVNCQLRDHCLPTLVADPRRLLAYQEREVFGCDF